MPVPISPVLLLSFCHLLLAQFWTSVNLEMMEWSNNCDLRSTCIRPTLQLRIVNILNNETVSKTLNVDFEKQLSGTHLVSYWSEGTADMIVSTITINGIDPDYDFSRLCDSTGTTFLFHQSAENRTELSGVCFKTQLTFANYSHQCSSVTNATMDEREKENLPSLLVMNVGCLIIGLVLGSVLLIVYHFLKRRCRSDDQIKRSATSKVSNAAAFWNDSENSCGNIRSQIFPVSVESKNSVVTNNLTVLSANSSFCSSI